MTNAYQKFFRDLVNGMTGVIPMPNKVNVSPNVLNDAIGFQQYYNLSDDFYMYITFEDKTTAQERSNISIPVSFSIRGTVPEIPVEVICNKILFNIENRIEQLKSNFLIKRLCSDSYEWAEKVVDLYGPPRHIILSQKGLYQLQRNLWGMELLKSAPRSTTFDSLSLLPTTSLLPDDNELFCDSLAPQNEVAFFLYGDEDMLTERILFNKSNVIWSNTLAPLSEMGLHITIRMEVVLRGEKDAVRMVLLT